MESRAGISPLQVRVLLIITVIVTAVTTHWIDRARALDVRRITAQEISEMAGWLDEYYASAEGLQRPGGLCEGGRLDHGAIGAWLFESYLQTRLRSTPEKARAAIAAGIQQSDEWRRKHPGQ